MNLSSTDIIDRIRKIYTSCGPAEQKVLRQILQELADTGESPTYEQVWLADYKEIPVDKETFLRSEEYLGASNNCGQSIYPVWMDVMKELEQAGNQYYEIVFTGATRTGKTSTAVSDASYQLYKIMCLRNPQEYFGLKKVTRISIFFFNLTETLARGVAYKEFISTLSTSKWFQQHGYFTKSDTNPTYIPEGGLIEIVYGSAASHALGKATYCVVGNTKVLTDNGYCAISDLEDQHIIVYQTSPEGKVLQSEAMVMCTGYTQDTIRIELEDGSIIEGTPDHKILLSDGRYIPLGELTEDDDVMEVVIHED